MWIPYTLTHAICSIWIDGHGHIVAAPHLLEIEVDPVLFDPRRSSWLVITAVQHAQTLTGINTINLSTTQPLNVLSHVYNGMWSIWDQMLTSCRDGRQCSSSQTPRPFGPCTDQQCCADPGMSCDLFTVVRSWWYCHYCNLWIACLVLNVQRIVLHTYDMRPLVQR